MLELVDTHLKKGGYTHDRCKAALHEDDLDFLLKDIPYSNEVLK